MMMADCNDNGVLDADDIAMGTSTDVNGNGVPDECECMRSTYCTPTANSTGAPAAIDGAGLPSLSVGDFTLLATHVPPFEPAFFLYGLAPDQAPFGLGVRCVQGGLTKLKPLFITGSSGTAALALDLQRPQVPLAAGETGYFQLFYRDAAAGGFNTSDGLAVTFCQ
jgi:hypothetical protein